MSPRHGRPWAALSAVVVLLTIAPVAVIGHAELDTISPANKSSGPSPTEIVGTFVQNLDPKKSSFAVVDSTGKVIAQGGQVASDDVRKMTLPLTAPLAPGAYVIRWTTVSTEDGELARGTTTFTVAATPAPSAGPTPSAAPSASPPASAPSLSSSPTAAPSVAPAPATSTSDAVIPVIVALIVLAALGTWLLRSRSRRAG